MSDLGRHDLVVVTGRLPAGPPGAARPRTRWTGEHAALASALQPALAAHDGALIGSDGTTGAVALTGRMHSVSPLPVPHTRARWPITSTISAPRRPSLLPLVRY